jgi:hypothetical protein
MRVFFFIVIAALIISCKIYKSPIDAREYAKIGEGGGFTGLWQFYYILPNGQVFEEKTNGTFVEKKRIKVNISKVDIDKIKTAIATESPVKHPPGNMNRTFIFKQNNKEMSVTWEMNSASKLDSLYDGLKMQIAN